MTKIKFNIFVDYEWVIKNYRSCVNYSQLNSASELHKLFVKKWIKDKDINHFHKELLQITMQMSENLNGKNN